MMNDIKFSNANSRDTYFTVHNIKKAHAISKGKGIKVGIIDWLFAYEENKDLYAGCVNISGDALSLYEQDGHGHMMAVTLREIAPECEIYAINAVMHNDGGEASRIGFFEKAIQWAIKKQIHILTYSNAPFNGEERKRANTAIEKAVKNGIITTFIHNDSDYNIWPYGCMSFSNQMFGRLPDLNIYQFDYNYLYLPQYEKYTKTIENGGEIHSGDDLPYFSFSSMSVVLAGFIAILKSIKPSLNSEDCKELLIRTSYEITEFGDYWYDLNPCEHVADIGKAAEAAL
jgi:hypothetical protein